MTRWLLGLALVLGLSAAGRAQYPPGYGNGYNGYGNPGFGGVPGYNGGYGTTPGFPGAPGYGFPPTGNAFGGFGGQPVNPAFPNRGLNQPLSPYLNLLRNNPAVNYYNFARPGTAAGQTGAAGFNGALGFSQVRQGFVPLAAFPTETPTEFPPVGPQTYLPSEAHPVTYGNRYGPLAGTLPTGPTGVGGAGAGGRAGGFNRPFSQQGQGQGSTQGSGAPAAPRTR